MSNSSSTESGSRRCTKCGETKPLAEFYKDILARGGFKSECKQCTLARMSTYHRQNRDLIRERSRSRRKTNKKLIATQRKARYERQSEIIKNRVRKYDRTMAGYTSRLWMRLNDRTINGSHPRWSNPRCRQYLTKGVRLEFTRLELSAFVENWWPIIDALLDSDDSPSIDRINSDGPYSAANCRFIPMRENFLISCRLGAKTRALKSTV